MPEEKEKITSQKAIRKLWLNYFHFFRERDGKYIFYLFAVLEIKEPSSPPVYIPAAKCFGLSLSGAISCGGKDNFD